MTKLVSFGLVFKPSSPLNQSDSVMGLSEGNTPSTYKGVFQEYTGSLEDLRLSVCKLPSFVSYFEVQVECANLRCVFGGTPA